MLYTTRFTPVECAMKAQSAIVAEADVVGVADADLVLVRKTKGNMFQTVVRAELTQTEDGSAINLTAGMDRIVFVFAMIFLAAFLLVDMVYLVAFLRIFQSFQFSDQDRKDVLFVSLPFISTVLLVGLAQLGRYMSREEGPVLTRMLVDAMDAKSVKAKPVVKPAPKPAAVSTPEPPPPADS